MNQFQPVTHKRRRTLAIPIVVGAVCLGALLWIGSHVQDNCLELKDLFTMCPPPALLAK